MKNQSVLSPVLIIILLTAPFLSFSQYILQEGYISTDLFEKANDEFSYKNLRIFPLTGGTNFKLAHADIGTYTNLEEVVIP